MISRHLIKKIDFKIKIYYKLLSTVSIHNKRQPTAGIIIIGDEILKGQVLDTNSHFLTKRLYNLGIKVCQVSIIGDVELDIIDRVQEFSSRFTYVLTSGGIGPTHDDITFAAVAKAIGEPLIPHPELVKICTKFFDTQDMNSPQMKLAFIPKNARLKFGFDKIQGKRSFFPNVSVNNIYFFPGIPALMEKLFDMLAEDLFGGSSTIFHHKERYINIREDQLASNLNELVEQYPLVTIGSYPDINNSLYKVKITFESLNEEILNEAIEKFEKSIAPEYLISNLSTDEFNQIKDLSKEIHSDSSRKIFTIFQQYRFDEIVIIAQINITKETLILMHLLFSCKKKLNLNEKLSIFAFKVTEKEVKDNFETCAKRYNFDLITNSQSLKESLPSFLKNHPKVKLIISSEFNDNEANFLANNEVILINPLSHWADTDISEFIDRFSLKNDLFQEKN